MKQTLKSSVCLLVCVLLLAAFAVPGNAAEIYYSGTCGDNLTWTLDSYGCLTVSGTGEMKSYYPENPPWDEYYTRIRRVVIGDQVTSIADFAFNNLPELGTVVIGSSVASIGGSAFGSCPLLSTVEIPASVTSIHLTAFSNCAGLWKFIVDPANPNYSSDDSGVLFNKNKTTLIQAPTDLGGDYQIPAGVTTIEANAFKGCSLLHTMVIPDSVISIGDSAFSGCSYMYSLTLGNSIKTIGASAFYGCDNLSSITLPESVKTLGHNAFGYCDYLKKVTLNEGLTEIGSSAFAYCERLEEITIPDSVTWMGFYAFQGCSKLASVTLGTGIDRLCSQTFDHCDVLTNVTIPANVTSIQDQVFYYCYKLGTVTFEGSAPTIGKNVFYRASAVKAYYPNNDASWTSSVRQNYGGSVTWIAYAPTVAEGKCGDKLTWKLDTDNVLTISGTGAMYDYEPSTNPAPWADYTDTVTKIVVNSGATKLGTCAFKYFTKLETVSLPTTLEGISYECFLYCPSLKSITLPSGMTYIRSNAFEQCTALESVVIPDGVTSIGMSAFVGCTGLKTVTIPASVTSLGSYCFSNCPALTEIYFGGTEEAWAAFGSGISTAGYVHYECTDPEGHWAAVSVDATCTEDGYTGEGCACGYVRNKTVTETAPGHTEETVPGYDATCTETGLTDGVICTVCGETLTAQEEIPAKGHTEETVPGYDATCTETGLTDGVKCSVCGETIVEQTVIPTNGHNYENGSCTVCGEADPDYVAPVLATISQKGRNLEYKDMIYVIDIFELTGVEGIDLTTDAGILVWSQEEYAALNGNIVYDEAHAKPGLESYPARPEYYFGKSDGIFTRDLYKTAWYAGYVKLHDGTYVYSEAKEYGPETYAYKMLVSGTEETKTLCVALLNYISAAQKYFDSSTPDSELVNYELTTEQKALTWDNPELNLAATEIPAGKDVTRDKTVFAGRGKNLLFEEMISLVSVYVIDTATVNAAQECGTIFWTAEQFEALTGAPGVENYGEGTKVTGFNIYQSTDGQWYSAAPAVAPKDMSDTEYYILGYLIDADGNVHYSGVMSYTFEQYIANMANNANMGEFAKRLYYYERAVKAALG